MIRGKFLTSQDDAGAVMDIRRRVFVEEQGYSADTEIDGFDKMAVYALAFDENDRPAGTGRLIINDESRFQIGRVCVLKEARGQGLGDLVVRMLLYRALELGAGEIWLGAQLPAVGFYARYGFAPIGEIYDDEGVPHRWMRALAGEVDLEGSCGGHSRCAGCAGDCSTCEGK